MLDNKQIQFIAQRKKLVRLWPVAGSFLIVLLIALTCWLYFRAPLLINPVDVMGRLDAGTIEKSMLLTSTVLLPVIMLTCIVILSIMVIFAFAAFSTERKHLQLIEKLLEERKR